MFQIGDRRWLIAQVRKAVPDELASEERRISNQQPPIGNLEHPYKFSIIIR
jgi:hypothetical protein